MAARLAAKGLPGWQGRAACLKHVLSYTATLAAFLALARWWLGIPQPVLWGLAGLTLSAATHYFADRRTPLERLAELWPGKIGFYRAGGGLATGAALLDQAWHWCWLLVSALVISGPPS